MRGLAHVNRPVSLPQPFVESGKLRFIGREGASTKFPCVMQALELLLKMSRWLVGEALESVDHFRRGKASRTRKGGGDDSVATYHSLYRSLAGKIGVFAFSATEFGDRGSSAAMARCSSKSRGSKSQERTGF